MSLLGYNFRSFAPALALSILDPKISFTEQEGMEGASTENIFGGQTPILTPYDLKRLESYSNNLVDYHLVRFFSLPFL
jgi:N-acetyltransferase 10